MIFAMPNKPGEFSRFDFPEVLPAPLNGTQIVKTSISWVVFDVEEYTNVFNCQQWYSDLCCKIIFQRRPHSTVLKVLHHKVAGSTQLTLALS